MAFYLVRDDADGSSTQLGPYLTVPDALDHLAKGVSPKDGWRIEKLATTESVAAR